MLAPVRQLTCSRQTPLGWIREQTLLSHDSPGRLYLDDTEGLAYFDETVVDMLAVRVGHRKVRTELELLAVVRESKRGLPSIRAWVLEELEEIVRGLCEAVIRRPTSRGT